MNWFTKTWKWLDQKKTMIGSLALIASEVVPDPTITAILKGVGIIFGATGVVHKVAKKDYGDNILPSGIKKLIMRKNDGK